MAALRRRAEEPAPKPKRAEGRPLPTEEELEVQLGTIMRALESLPEGLPTELDLFDEATIAKRIVRGRKSWTEDGRLTAFIQGNWYYADPSDPEFMDQYEVG